MIPTKRLPSALKEKVLGERYSLRRDPSPLEACYTRKPCKCLHPHWKRKSRQAYLDVSLPHPSEITVRGGTPQVVWKSKSLEYLLYTEAVQVTLPLPPLGKEG